MTQSEIIDLFIRNAQAGQHPNASRFTYAFVKQNINAVRAGSIAQFVASKRQVSHLWYITTTAYYDVNYQDDLSLQNCCTKYLLPRTINTGFTDGYSFIGNDENNAFNRVNSRSELSMIMNHPHMKPVNSGKPTVLIESDIAEVYYPTGDKIKADLVVTFLPEDPEECKTFNVEKDTYPISMELIPLMQESLWKRMIQQANAPVDTKNNRNDIPTPPMK